MDTSLYPYDMSPKVQISHKLTGLTLICPPQCFHLTMWSAQAPVLVKSHVARCSAQKNLVKGYLQELRLLFCVLCDKSWSSLKWIYSVTWISSPLHKWPGKVMLKCEKVFHHTLVCYKVIAMYLYNDMPVAIFLRKHTSWNNKNL